jgi:hypothetical protein
MKASASMLLLLVTVLVISRRVGGMDDWHSMEDFDQSSSYDSLAPSDKSTANTLTFGHSNSVVRHPGYSTWEVMDTDPSSSSLRVPDPDIWSLEDLDLRHTNIEDLEHFMMEDHPISLPINPHNVVSSPPEAPGTDSAIAPSNLAAETLQGLPSGRSLDDSNVKSVAASQRKKIRTESSRQAKRRQKEISPLVQQNLPLLDCIGMNENEAGFQELVFHERDFEWSIYDTPAFVERKRCIVNIMSERAKSRPNLSILTIHSQDMRNIERAFIRNPAPLNCLKAPSPSVLAMKRITDCFIKSTKWMMVYEKRLGINFAISEQWILHASEASSAGLTVRMTGKVNQMFVAYIFFVDMIITLLPKPSGVTVDRMQAFRTAVNCFEIVTKEAMKEKPFLRKATTIGFVWRCLSSWIVQHGQYQSTLKVPDRVIEGDYVWKTVFNFIFAHSINSLTLKL